MTFAIANAQNVFPALLRKKNKVFGIRRQLRYNVSVEIQRRTRESALTFFSDKEVKVDFHSGEKTVV